MQFYSSPPPPPPPPPPSPSPTPAPALSPSPHRINPSSTFTKPLPTVPSSKLKVEPDKELKNWSANSMESPTGIIKAKRVKTRMELDLDSDSNLNPNPHLMNQDRPGLRFSSNLGEKFDDRRRKVLAANTVADAEVGVGGAPGVNDGSQRLRETNGKRIRNNNSDDSSLQRRTGASLERDGRDLEVRDGDDGDGDGKGSARIMDNINARHNNINNAVVMAGTSLKTASGSRLASGKRMKTIPARAFKTHGGSGKNHDGERAFEHLLQHQSRPSRPQQHHRSSSNPNNNNNNEDDTSSSNRQHPHCKRQQHHQLRRHTRPPFPSPPITSRFSSSSAEMRFNQNRINGAKFQNGNSSSHEHRNGDAATSNGSGFGGLSDEERLVASPEEYHSAKLVGGKEEQEQPQPQPEQDPTSSASHEGRSYNHNTKNNDDNSSRPGQRDHASGFKFPVAHILESASRTPATRRTSMGHYRESSTGHLKRGHSLAGTTGTAGGGERGEESGSGSNGNKPTLSLSLPVSSLSLNQDSPATSGDGGVKTPPENSNGNGTAYPSPSSPHSNSSATASPSTRKSLTPVAFHLPTYRVMHGRLRKDGDEDEAQDDSRHNHGGISVEGHDETFPWTTPTKLIKDGNGNQELVAFPTTSPGSSPPLMSATTTSTDVRLNRPIFDSNSNLVPKTNHLIRKPQRPENSFSHIATEMSSGLNPSISASTSASLSTSTSNSSSLAPRMNLTTTPLDNNNNQTSLSPSGSNNAGRSPNGRVRDLVNALEEAYSTPTATKTGRYGQDAWSPDGSAEKKGMELQTQMKTQLDARPLEKEKSLLNNGRSPSPSRLFPTRIRFRSSSSRERQNSSSNSKKRFSSGRSSRPQSPTRHEQRPEKSAAALHQDVTKPSFIVKRSSGSLNQEPIANSSSVPDSLGTTVAADPAAPMVRHNSSLFVANPDPPSTTSSPNNFRTSPVPRLRPPPALARSLLPHGAGLSESSPSIPRQTNRAAHHRSKSDTSNLRSSSNSKDSQGFLFQDPYPTYVHDSPSSSNVARRRSLPTTPTLASLAQYSGPDYFSEVDRSEPIFLGLDSNTSHSRYLVGTPPTQPDKELSQQQSDRRSSNKLQKPRPTLTRKRRSALTRSITQAVINPLKPAPEDTLGAALSSGGHDAPSESPKANRSADDHSNTTGFSVLRGRSITTKAASRTSPSRPPPVSSLVLSRPDPSNTDLTSEGHGAALDNGHQDAPPATPPPKRETRSLDPRSTAAASSPFFSSTRERAPVHLEEEEDAEKRDIRTGSEVTIKPNGNRAEGGWLADDGGYFEIWANEVENEMSKAMESVQIRTSDNQNDNWKDRSSPEYSRDVTGRPQLTTAQRERLNQGTITRKLSAQSWIGDDEDRSHYANPRYFVGYDPIVTAGVSESQTNKGSSSFELLRPPSASEDNGSKLSLPRKRPPARPSLGTSSRRKSVMSAIFTYKKESKEDSDTPSPSKVSPLLSSKLKKRQAKTRSTPVYGVERIECPDGFLATRYSSPSNPPDDSDSRPRAQSATPSALFKKTSFEAKGMSTPASPVHLGSYKRSRHRSQSQSRTSLTRVSQETADTSGLSALFSQPSQSSKSSHGENGSGSSASNHLVGAPRSSEDGDNARNISIFDSKGLNALKRIISIQEDDVFAKELTQIYQDSGFNIDATLANTSSGNLATEVSKAKRRSEELFSGRSIDQGLDAPASKSEIQMCFIIRELVSTERSYGRNLAALAKVAEETKASLELPESYTLPVMSDRRAVGRRQTTLIRLEPEPLNPQDQVALILAHIPKLSDFSLSLLKCFEDEPCPWGIACSILTRADEMKRLFSSFSAVLDRTLDSCKIGPIRSVNLKHLEVNLNSSSLGKKSNAKSYCDRRWCSPVDILVQPMQRLLRYPLMLREILKHTHSPSPFYTLVDQALENICTIASECERTRNNHPVKKPPNLHRPTM